MQSKEEIEKVYWQGYIKKQNEAMEICKQCKYIKKVKKLESDKQELIEKLEEDIKRVNCGEILSIRSILKDCLEILKGENDE